MTRPASDGLPPTVDAPRAEARETPSPLDPQATQTYKSGDKKPPPADERGKLPSVPGYEIEGVLGRGGMGVVYRARHLALNRPVALKMILAGAHADLEEIARFRIEAEAEARLQHPNIVQVFEVGEHDGLPYCALEFVDGGSLAQKLGGKPQPPREAARLAEALAEAMHLAHSRNVVHRDLKPANVLLTAAGVPKVTDFGLAKQLDADSGQTRTGAVMGTPAYMAPEQAGGLTHAVGPSADVYALGVILYECLTGRPPFSGATILETLEQVRGKEPPSPRQFNPKTPRDLEIICLKCLRKEPEKRYASALALAEDLRRWKTGRPIRARPVGPAERVVKWMGRNPVVTALLALVALALAGGAAGIYLKYLDAKAETAEKVKETLAKDAALKAKEDALKKVEDALKAKDDALKAKDDALRDKDQANGKLEAELANGKVQLASGAWDKGEPILARELLGQAPAPRRGWEWHFLHQSFEGGLFTLYDHAAGISAVAFSPDGAFLATAGADGTARLWNARTGASMLEYKGHKGPVVGLAFSPDGAFLATASQDQTARLWDVHTGASVREFKGHTSSVVGVAFSPDGAVLADASQDQTARLWSVGTGAKLQELKGHTGQVLGVAFSPDGARVATAGSEGTVRLWDSRSGAFQKELKGHTSAVTSVAFSPDGVRLASSSADATARLWDAHTGDFLQELKGHTSPVVCVAFSPDGLRLATACYDKTARLWDARTGATLLELKGHTDKVVGVAFSPDGARVATAGYDQTARLWDARTSAALLDVRGHTGFVAGVAFSHDGALLATAGYDNSARLWDAHTGAALQQLTGHTEPVAGVAFSSDGAFLATASHDMTARLWDAHTGAALREFKGHTGLVRGVAFSPDGNRLATASHDKTARLWDAHTGRVLAELKLHTREVEGVAFSSDGALLATVSRDAAARLWDGKTGAPLRELKGHTGLVMAAAFSPDGAFLATAGYDKTARLWDARTGAALRELRGHTGPVTGVAFSPDGTRLASSSQDGTLRLWDAHTGAALLEIKAHPSLVLGVAFSPDGARLADASADKTARLWDARPDAVSIDLKGHTNNVMDVAFSPDGSRLTGWDLTRRPITWDLTAGRPLPDAAPADPAAGSLRSPDGRRLVVIEGTGVRVVDVNPPEGNELAYRQWATRPDPFWHLDEAERLQREGEAFAAGFHIDRADGLPPTSAWLLRRGETAARLGRWPQARADFALVCDQAPADVLAWRRLALVQLAGGQVVAYQQTCTGLRARFGAPPEAAAGLLFAAPPGDLFGAIPGIRAAQDSFLPEAARARPLVARTCVLRPDGPDPAGLLSLAGGDALVRAAVLCRASRHDEAVQALAGRNDPLSLLWRARAECGRTRPDAARQALEQAGKWLTAASGDDPKRTNGERLTWEERLEIELLLREVEMQLKG